MAHDRAAGFLTAFECVIINIGSNGRAALAKGAALIERISCAALISIVAAPCIFNITMLILGGCLSIHVPIKLDMPIREAVFALFVLLTVKLLVENKHLKDDNDLFI